MKMANRRYELTDEQWERVKDMIQHSKMGRPPKDDRQMRNATLLRIFRFLNEDTDMENLSLDSTVIKAHPHSAGAKKGCKQRK